MDNLTHSLAGALLGRMGLKRLTGLAMPTAILGANAPDIDVFLPLVTGVPGLVVHRGFTHGVGGLVVLPVLLAGAMLAWNRVRPSAEPVRPAGQLLVAFVAVLSHPLLDFATSYGTRLLEPLSSRWFYGDAIFIIDPLVWLALILGLELSWRSERLGRRDWHRPAAATFAAICAYIAANLVITERARSAAEQQLRAAGLQPTLVAAVPQPLEFWKRRILWRSADSYGSGWFVPASGARLDEAVARNGLEHRHLAAQRRRPDVSAFLFWSRMPVVVEQGGRAFLGDQRFLDRARSNFLVPLDKPAAGP